MLHPFLGELPVVSSSAYIAPGAQVIGSVTLSDEASVWYNAVLRGDVGAIVIGCRSNIQDLSVVHTDEGVGVHIGEDVTVGHSCVLHGCTIGNGSLIGMGSIILNNAEIGECCLIGAGSMITERKVFPSRTLIMGRPAKVVRDLTPEEIAGLAANTARYVERAREHRQNR